MKANFVVGQFYPDLPVKVSDFGRQDAEGSWSLMALLAGQEVRTALHQGTPASRSRAEGVINMALDVSLAQSWKDIDAQRCHKRLMKLRKAMDDAFNAATDKGIHEGQARYGHHRLGAQQNGQSSAALR